MNFVYRVDLHPQKIEPLPNIEYHIKNEYEHDLIDYGDSDNNQDLQV
jgi:hypothetical protein